MSDYLKQIVQDIVNGRTEQALATFHSYATEKTQELAGLTEKKWSGDVETKWTPPEGLFSKSAEAIASHLKRASDSHGQAASRLSFYINRAGKNLSADEKAKLKDAQAKLKAMYEELDEATGLKAIKAANPKEFADRKAAAKAERDKLDGVKYQVDMDTVFSGVAHTKAAVEKELVKLGKRFDAEGKILKLDGPGGGNPLIRWTGGRAALEKLLDSWYSTNDDGEDAAQKKRIKKA